MASPIATFCLATQRLMTSVFLRATTAIIAVVLASSAALGQSMTSVVRIEPDSIPGLYSGTAPLPQCMQQISNASRATAIASCMPLPSVTVSGYAAASSQGLLRSRVSLDANNAILLPSLTHGSVASALASAGFRDVVSIAPLGQNFTLAPTSFSLGVDWNGVYSWPLGLGIDASPFFTGFLGFIGGSPGSGWTGITRSYSVLPTNALIIEDGVGRFAGTATRNWEGNRLVTRIGGVSNFINVPLSSMTFDFYLHLLTEVQLKNVSASSIVANGALLNDFSNTATISSFRVLSGTTDITEQVRVSFASGFVAPQQVVPEPTTLLLIAGGLALIVPLIARRAARAGTT